MYALSLLDDILAFMRRSKQSPKSDKKASVSPERDVRQVLFDALREARLNRQLSQQALARKLGLRQRQISDLERAAMDPRLSTIQNVGRALDLELMLIPRSLISAVEGLQRVSSNFTKRPMYALDDEDAESGPGDQSRVEVGSTDDPGDPAAQQRRRAKGPR